LINKPTETQAAKSRLQHRLPSQQFPSKSASWGAANCIVYVNDKDSY